MSMIHESARSGRSYGLDNAKFAFVLLVVLGHALEQVRHVSAAAKTLYYFIYLFHIPALAFISGAVSSSTFDAVRARRWLAALVIPYVVFQAMYLLADSYWNSKSFSYGLATPYWLLWYLVSLACWRLFLPAALSVRYPVVATLIVAALAGMLPEIGTEYSLSRTFVFFPFFVAGHLYHSRAGIGPRWLAWLCLLGLFGLAWLVRNQPAAWLYGSQGYSRLGLGDMQGVLVRGGLILSGAVGTWAALRVIPQSASWLSRLGAYSIGAYILHGFVVKQAVSSKWFSSLDGLQPWLIILLLALIATLSTIGMCWVAKYMKPLLNYDWLWGVLGKARNLVENSRPAGKPAETHDSTEVRTFSAREKSPVRDALNPFLSLLLVIVILSLSWLASKVGYSGFTYSGRGLLFDCLLISVFVILARPALKSYVRLGFLVASAVFVLSYGHVLKVAFLGAPIHVSDISALVALLKVLDGWRFWLAAGVTLLVIVSIAWAMFPRRGKWLWSVLALSYAASLPMIGTLFSTAESSESGTGFDSVERVSAIGGVAYLIEDFARARASQQGAPDQDDVANALSHVGLLDMKIASRRNVHVVLLETIWDPLKLSGYKFNRDPFDSRFRDLIVQSKGSGALSPVFGSLTANAEFEILCGFPAPADDIMFTSRLKRRMPCLPMVLRESGYRTFASHANDADFWSRDRAYDLIGFETYSAVRSFVVEDLDGPYLNDASMFAQSMGFLQEGEKAKPYLNYMVTLSSHYPYKRDTVKRPDVVKSSPSAKLLDAYANSAYYTTRAFMDWVEQVRANDPDALIVAFGDHAPVLGSEPDPYFESGLPISGGGRSAEVLASLSETPLIVIDGKRGVLPVGRLPMTAVPRMILNLLGNSADEPESAHGMAREDDIGNIRRFQGRLLTRQDGEWVVCATGQSDPGEGCRSAQQLLGAQITLRNDLAWGQQLAFAHTNLGKILYLPHMTVDDKAQKCFVDVLAWGPKDVPVGQAFNVQSGGRSAIWMKVARRAGSPSLRVGDETVPITFGEDVGAASWQDPGFLKKAGSYPVDVLCEGEPPVRLGTFEVQQIGGDVGVARPNSDSHDAPSARRSVEIDTVYRDKRVETLELSATGGTCEGESRSGMTLKMHWKVRELPGIDVHVKGAGPDPQKLWIRAGAEGQETTGPWISNNHSIVLTAADQKTRLAEILVRTPNCH